MTFPEVPAGWTISWAKETGSTNRDALALLTVGRANDRTVLAADSQSAGRGRMDREWFSPPGVNIYASAILCPEIDDPPLLATLPLLVGLGIAKAVAAAAKGGGAMVKWPNDIWLNGRKVCGILCEMHTRPGGLPTVVAGFGLNVNLKAEDLPDDLKPRATSLAIETGKSFDRREILADVLRRFDPLYRIWRGAGLKPFLAELNSLNALRGYRVKMALTGEPLSGVAGEIREDGGLELRLDDGTVRAVYSGEAHITEVGVTYPTL